MREAPAINKMYRIIKSNPKLNEKIRIIGFGAMDDIYNVKYFKNTFKVEFPLFPDKDRVVHKQLGEPEIPFFVSVKKNDKGTIEIFNTHLGAITVVEDFINMLIASGGLEH